MLVVRPATDSDVAALAGLGERAFLAAYSEAGPAGDVSDHIERHFSRSAVEAAMRADEQAYLIALLDDEAVGFAKLRNGNAPAELPSENVLEVAQLYVAPERQRSGVGAALIDAVCDLACEENYDGVWLGVWERADWAIAFYRRSGFEEAGRLEFRLGNEVQNDFLMWLPLSG